jgi:fermentation-respiration switch protein FrsA (DUF1100 family)
MHDQFDTLSRIGSIDVPLAIVVGADDEVVPNEQSRRVYEAAKQPDLFLSLAGQDHGGVEARSGDLAIDQITRFVNDHAGCTTAPVAAR